MSDLYLGLYQHQTVCLDEIQFVEVCCDELQWFHIGKADYRLKACETSL